MPSEHSRDRQGGLLRDLAERAGMKIAIVQSGGRTLQKLLDFSHLAISTFYSSESVGYSHLHSLSSPYADATKVCDN